MKQKTFEKSIKGLMSILLAVFTISSSLTQPKSLNAYEIRNLEYQKSFEVSYDGKIISYTGEDEYLFIKNEIDEQFVNSIISNAFVNNNTLTEIKIEKGVEVIQSSSFINCSKLNKIYIPESIHSINDGAFINYIEDFTIVGYVGSEAERYALKYNIPFRLMGDLDKNGKITVVDLLRLKKFFLNMDVLDDYTLKISDINMDNEVNILDMVGLINSLLSNNKNVISNTALFNPNLNSLSKDGSYINEEITGFIDFTTSSTSKVLLDENQLYKNSVYSPISYYMALSLVTDFSDGNTKQELLNALKVADLEKLKINNRNIFKGSYINNNKGYCLFANSIWLNNSYGFNYNQSALKSLSENYYAYAFNENFNDTTVQEKITNWIIENTGNKIKDISVNLNPEELIRVINTVNFDNKWIEEFKITKIDKFYLDENSSVDSEFMLRKKDNANAVINELYTKSYLEMENHCKMNLILPSDKCSVEEILKNENMLKDIISDKESYQKFIINYEIPKFEIKSEFNLKKSANELGIYDAFNPNKADFKNILQDNIETSDLFISNILQKANFKIDEKSCSAAAYTDIVMPTTTSMPFNLTEIDFKLNKPFIYYVTDQNNLVLFIGVVYNPIL